MSIVRAVLRAQPSWWLGVSLLMMLALAVQVGAVPVHTSDWLAMPKLFEWSAVGDSIQTLSAGSHVLFNLRLPRLLLSVLVGASLGLSGAHPRIRLGLSRLKVRSHFFSCHRVHGCILLRIFNG